MLVRNPEKEHFSLLKEKGLGFIAFSPLAQGLLTDRYLNGIPVGSRAMRDGSSLHREDITPVLVEKLRKLNQIAADRGQSLAQMSLAWGLSKQELTSVIVGASSVRQLENNLSAIDNIEFTSDELARIDSIVK